MKGSDLPLKLLLIPCLLGTLLEIAPAQEGDGANPDARPRVPEELLDDPHFRSEFGLNEWTTPSITKIFELLETLGEVSLDEVDGRALSDASGTPVDRSFLALALGGLMAEGFFMVQARDLSGLEPLARSIVTHCSALGAGMRATRHARALMEHAAMGDWAKLKRELGATQRDVEYELVALRDVTAVQMISLGGWIRAFELATSVIDAGFEESKAELLRRLDVADYYMDALQYLEPDVLEQRAIEALRDRLGELHRTLARLEPGTPLTPRHVRDLEKVAARLSAAAFSAADP